MYWRMMKGLVFLAGGGQPWRGQTPDNPPVTYRVNTVAGIRRIEPDGRVSTVAGDGVNAAIVDTFNPEAAARRLSLPRAIATDGERYLYISEPNFNRIRRLNLETHEIITIIGGRGAGFSADGTIGTSARLREVLEIAVDAQGDLIIAETGNHRVRR